MRREAESGGNVVRRVRSGRPLRVALLMELAPRKLGSFEDLTLEICREARRRGHDVHVFCRAPVHEAVARSLAGMKAGLEMIDGLERAPLAAVARLRSYDVLQLHHFGARDGIALLACAAWPARVLYVDRGSLQPDEHGKRLRRVVGRVLDRVSALRFAGVRCVSRYVCELDAARFGRDLCGTILNGVDLDRFRPAPGVPHREFHVVCVAHLIPEKGVGVLLEAMSRLQHGEARLTVVGDGPQLPALQEKARELGLAQRVEFAGLRSDVQRFLAGADVFVHPALWSEAFGYTIAEAQACGVPVIATAVGGIPEVVANGETGILVPPREAAPLAAAIDRLASDRALLARMAGAARRRAEALFDVRACARSYVDWSEESTRS